MASLAISAAINIGVGLLLFHLFPAEGEEAEAGLDDLSVTGSEYGGNIHVGYGVIRMNGNLFWAPDIEEVAGDDDAGSKSGSSSTESSAAYTYFASFAISFAEGPAKALLRMWADNKLIYDATGTGDIESEVELSFQFYPGDGNHALDPLIQANVDGLYGVGSTPAYNKVCFIVANRWALADFGNRIPNITAEIAFETTESLPFEGLVELPGHDIPGSLTGAALGNATWLDPFSNKLYFLKMQVDGTGVADAFTMSDVSLIPAGGSQDRTLFVSKDGFIYGQYGAANANPFTMYEGLSATNITSFGISNALYDESLPDVFPNPSTGGSIVETIEGSGLAAKKTLYFSFVNDGGYSWYEQDIADPTVVTHLGTDLDPQNRSLLGGYVISNWWTNEAYIIQETNTDLEIFKPTSTLNVGQPPSVTFTRVVQATKASLGMGAEPVRGWIFLPNENAIILGTGTPAAGSMVKFDLDDWSVINSRQDFGFSCKQEWATNGRWSTHSHNSVSGAGTLYTIDTDSLLTTSTALSALAFGASEDSGLNPSCSFDPRSDSVIYSRQHSSSFQPSTDRVVKVFVNRPEGVPQPLEDVVTDICARAGLPAIDIDVTELVGDVVRGYAITRVGTYRSALEPLQKAFLFDGVEIDWKLKFVKRGGAAALTIAEDDIGKLGDKEQIEEKRIQEVELPERVVVEFADKDKDYEFSTAYDKRVALPLPTQHSRSELKVELPLVMTPTEAKQLASKALYTAWAERLSIDSSLPWRYIRLDPTDIADMIFRGETRQIRMGEIEVGADLSLDFTAVQEDVTTYISTLTGTGGDGFKAQVPFGGLPTKWIPMNLPLLTAGDATQQAANRVYYGLAGYEDGWPGSSLFQSLDSGVSYLQISTFNIECSWGAIIGILSSLYDTTTNSHARKPGGAGGFTWDDETTIDVVPYRGLSRWTSSTDLEVLNGANAMAVIKRDGTAEIIQFVTVTAVDAATVRLSRILRGRRGTEDYGRTGYFGGETVVLLETARIASWRNALSRVNLSLPHKVVTSGTRLEDAEEQNFSANGEDLRPYSVAHITSSRSAGDLTTAWMRRTRYNGEFLDGTGTVPLNEASELYDVEYYLPAATTPFLTRTDLTSETDTLTKAEFEAAVGYDADQLAFTNWDFEIGGATQPPSNWQATGSGSPNWQSAASRGSIAGPPAGGGTLFAVVDDTTSGATTGDMVTTRKYSFLDDFGRDAAFMDALPLIDLDVQTTNPGDAAEGTEVFLRIYNSIDTLIQTITSGRITGTPGTWINTTVLDTAVLNDARTFDVLVRGDNNAGPPLDDVSGAVDQIKIHIGADEVPPIDVKVYQKSAVVGRGKSTRTRV